MKRWFKDWSGALLVLFGYAAVIAITAWQHDQYGQTVLFNGQKANALVYGDQRVVVNLPDDEPDPRVQGGWHHACADHHRRLPPPAHHHRDPGQLGGDEALVQPLRTIIIATQDLPGWFSIWHR